MAALLSGALVLATPTEPAASASVPVHQDALLAATSFTFIDGHDYPYGSTRMADEITGIYQYQPCAPGPCTPLTPPTTTDFVFLNQPDQYPGTLGLIDGPTAPTGEQSVNMGQNAIHQVLTTTHPPSPDNPVTVVGYSEGAVAASHEVSAWLPTSSVAFVLIGNPERPVGGILARLPAGTYIPVLGLTGGNATPSTGAPVVMVTQQYDGIADAPDYLFNVVADVNALLGAYYLHGNANYFAVDPTAAGNIVTTSADGNMTDILVPAAPGALPLFVPLAQAGVPQAILVALDPAVRAIIETGYDRTSDPSQQVRFALLPPASAWSGDVQTVLAGVTTTAQLLPGAVAASLPGAVAASLPGAPGAQVMTALTTSPKSPPLPVTTAPVNPSPPQRQVISQVQPAPHGQHYVITPRTNKTATDTGEQTSPPATTLSPDTSSPGQGPISTVSMRTNTRKDTIMPRETASGNKATPPSRNTGGSRSSNPTNPPLPALTGGTNAVGTVTGKPTKSPSTGSSSTASQSGGSGSSHG
jgi:hypothetical protein